MIRWRIRLIPVLAALALAMAGCGGIKEDLQPSDLIIPVDITAELSHQEAEVISYFEDRRGEFEALSNYLLENERVFGTRPVILHHDYAVELIQDPAIRSFANRLFKEGMVQMAASSNDDPIMQVDFLVDDNYGLYRQGITYDTTPPPSRYKPPVYNYTEIFKELGGNWYYYVHHYDSVKDEDQYRQLAWDQLTDTSTLTTPREQALVTLEAGENVGYWIDDRERELVVGVTFNTTQDGLLGPIKLFFDPATKELAGGSLRY